jgi:hypothetical protein
MFCRVDEYKQKDSFYTAAVQAGIALITEMTLEMGALDMAI